MFKKLTEMRERRALIKELGERHNLKNDDFVHLNKEKLAIIYNEYSDIDALLYMKLFCTHEWKDLVNRLIEWNNDGDFDSDEYLDGKWKLLNHFGLICLYGDAVVPKK